MPPRPSLAAAAVALLVTAPLIAQQQTDVPNRIDPRVKIYRENSPGSAPSSAVVVRNETEDTIIVTQIRLYSCENLMQGCSTYHPNTIVAPGRTATVMRFEPLGRNMPFNFAFESVFRTGGRSLLEGKAATKNALRTGEVSQVATPPGNRSDARTISVVHYKPASEQTISDPTLFTPFVAATADKEKGDCNDVTGGVNQPGDRTVAMTWLDGMLVKRSILVEFDSLWRIYRYTEIRRAPPPPKSARGTVGAQTTISITARGTATLANYSTDTSEAFFLRSPDILTAPALGRPGDMTAQIMKRCAKHTPPAEIAIARDPMIETVVTRHYTPDSGAVAIAPPAATSGSTSRANNALKTTTITTGVSHSMTLKPIYDPSSFVARVMADSGLGQCTVESNENVPRGGRRLGMAWIVDQKILHRRVTIEIDSARHPVSYSEDRYGVVPADAPDGTPRPQTIIKIIHGPDQASLMNVGGTAPDEGFALYLKNVMNLAALGTPQHVSAMIVATCGSKP